MEASYTSFAGERIMSIGLIPMNGAINPRLQIQRPAVWKPML
jgi:hypothetical protein